MAILGLNPKLRKMEPMKNPVVYMKERDDQGNITYMAKGIGSTGSTIYTIMSKEKYDAALASGEAKQGPKEKYDPSKKKPKRKSSKGKKAKKSAK